MSLHGNNSQHIGIQINCRFCLQIVRVNKVFITFSIKYTLQYPPHTIKSFKPYNVIVMAKKKSLRVFPRVVHHSNTSDKIHDFFRGRVVKIVSALVAPVAIDPFKL